MDRYIQISEMEAVTRWGEDKPVVVVPEAMSVSGIFEWTREELAPTDWDGLRRMCGQGASFWIRA